MAFKISFFFSLHFYWFVIRSLMITFIVQLRRDFHRIHLETRKLTFSIAQITKLLPGRALHGCCTKPPGFIYRLWCQRYLYMIFINQLFNGAPARRRMSTKMVSRPIQSMTQKKTDKSTHDSRNPNSLWMLRAVYETKTSAHSMVNVRVAHQLFTARANDIESREPVVAIISWPLKGTPECLRFESKKKHKLFASRVNWSTQQLTPPYGWWLGFLPGAPTI